MPNPPFQPLTLSVEQWNRVISDYVCAGRSPYADPILHECEAQAQEAASLRQLWEEVGKHIDAAAIGYNHAQIKAVFTENASLRQRLNELQARYDEGYRGFPVCNHHRDIAIWQTELNGMKAQLEQAQKERDLLRIDRDSWRRVSETLESQRSQAEAALEEMQKWLEDADGATHVSEVLAELQRRRSAPGQ